VIDSLCDEARGKGTAVVGLYCYFLAQQEQSTTSMLGAILKQLISRGRIPEHIKEAFHEAKKEFGGRDTNMQGVNEDCGFVVGIVVNGGGRQGTAGDCGGLRGTRGTAGDGRGRAVTASNHTKSPISNGVFIEYRIPIIKSL